MAIASREYFPARFFGVHRFFQKSIRITTLNYLRFNMIVITIIYRKIQKEYVT